MPGFCYFADGFHNPMNDAAIAALGLSYAFPTAPMYARLEGRTPSGGAGTIFGLEPQQPGGELAYRGPELQTWRKRPGDDCVWVGYWNEHCPTPEGLARLVQLPGPLVTLADGQRWRVPRLMAYEAEVGFAIDLPCYADLDADGNWCNGGVVAEYADAEKFAMRIYEGVIQAELGNGKRLTSEEVLGFSARLLQFNYLVSDVEVAMLRLFKVDEQLKEIVKAAASWQKFVDAVDKKKAASPG